ncbi:TolC family protein [Pseudoalteromonas denitrificans]|uniref:Outer membrane efflux protein n=1 Tax=Pseudoalteromonas denitrificans DSM 6059 TaxID=1123010 RepID=A0A1I1IXK2_9GAMM|nr:TolC family protein [Pseudoalteromonas denitrificans]SFC38433.1 Outer membrane efflux protein [Pseudoalteromonas denitrificans DSM 6059]
MKNSLLKLKPKRIIILGLLIHFNSVAEVPVSEQKLTLKRTIIVAQKNDPWLSGNQHKQDSVKSMSIAAGTYTDPKVSLSMANLPVDTFDISQEGMTQFKVGIAQMFPRGDSLAIKQKQLILDSEQYPYQRQDRKAKVALTVGQLWLDAYKVQNSIRLIEADRALFEQLTDVAEASYASAQGKTRQQDVIRAQLELTMLDDRLNQLQQQKNRYEGQLSQWVTGNNSQTSISVHNINLGEVLPDIRLLKAEMVKSNTWQTPDKLVKHFMAHPRILAIDKKITATAQGIALAKQDYEPQWGVNAGYAYRDNDPVGNTRADLFTVAVTFDLPLFTDKRQDQQLSAAISQTESVKTERLIILRQLLSAYSSAKGRLNRLVDRQRLYHTKLLPQIQDQAEASLTAYTNDDGDFAEVVRARIAQLNAKIENLAIDTQIQKVQLELNYLFITKAEQMLSFNKISQSNVQGQK